MKLNKKLTLLLMTILPFLLSGCIKFSLYIDVDRDSNAMYHGSLYVPETAIGSQDDLDLMYNELFKNIPLLNDRVNSETEIGEQKYKGCTFTGTGEELSTFVKIEKTGEDCMHLTFSSDPLLDNVSDLPLNLNIFEDKEKADISSLSEFGAEAYLEIRMPGKVFSASHGEIDGDTVKINLLETLGEEIEIVSAIHRPEVDAAVLGAGGAAELFCAYTIYRDSKRKKEGK